MTTGSRISHGTVRVFTSFTDVCVQTAQR